MLLEIFNTRLWRGVQNEMLANHQHTSTWLGLAPSCGSELPDCLNYGSADVHHKSLLQFRHHRVRRPIVISRGRRIGLNRIKSVDKAKLRRKWRDRHGVPMEAVVAVVGGTYFTSSVTSLEWRS